MEDSQSMAGPSFSTGEMRRPQVRSCVSNLSSLAQLLQGRPLTEAQLLSVCHAPPNDPARERGLTLRRITKAKRPKAIGYGVATSPTGFVFPSKSSGPESDDPSSTNEPSPTPKRMKRASTVSVLSGLGVDDPEKALESPSSPTHLDSDEKGP